MKGILEEGGGFQSLNQFWLSTYSLLGTILIKALEIQLYEQMKPRKQFLMSLYLLCYLYRYNVVSEKRSQILPNKHSKHSSVKRGKDG